MTKKLISFDDTKPGLGLPDVVEHRLERRRITPSLSPLTERAEPFRLATIQEQDAIYSTWSRTGGTPTWDKSVDGGETWTTLSTMPATCNAFAKLTSGTILAVEGKGTTTAGGSMPRVWRSTDDGATWSVVPAGLTFGPISSQGICEGTDGSVMIGEYGNVGEFSYRVRRSTDDGLTWETTFSSSGDEPQGDPGHIHSVTYDHVAEKHVIFVDRPINATWGGPHIYASGDNGATWDFVGESDHVDKPNFVSPMYFADYIAWGSDNQINGRISRIHRDDFYAGRFEKSETVAMLSQKALYFTFPLRPDVWAVSMAGEHIPSPRQEGGGGSTMNEVWLVSDNGKLVAGGMESYLSTTPAGQLSGVRASFPARAFDQVDHQGLVWANMPTGNPRPYAAIPATQGWGPPNTRVDLHTTNLPFGSSVRVHGSSGDPADRLTVFERTADTYVTVGTARAGHLRFYQNGRIEAWSGTGRAFAVSDNGFAFEGGVPISSNGVRIRGGLGVPEGSVSAPVGSLYTQWSPSAATNFWVKASGGSGNTGWVAVGHPTGATASRPSTPTLGQSYFDQTLGKPIWWSGTAWVDATGAPV